MPTIIISLLGFGVLTLASDTLGKVLNRIRFPLITGFLFTGILCGPYLLGLIQKPDVQNLLFINDLSLAFIAFAAGSELYLKDLRSSLRSIFGNTFGQLVVTFVLGGGAVYLLADIIPFMQGMDGAARLAVALLAGTIFVARSPASAIAVINELRAKGPFTQVAIGVTVIKDVLVIILFAICFSLSATLINGAAFNLAELGILFLELLVSFGLGYVLGKILSMMLELSVPPWLKALLVVMIGWGVYLFSHWVRHESPGWLGHEVYLEPLLICILGSFVVTNYSRFRIQWEELLHKNGPMIYVAFFTLTGASMSLDVLKEVWEIALILFAVRVGSLMLGGVLGGLIGKDPRSFLLVNWMPFVTQAGVSLGLGTIVATEYPAWGESFATIVIAVIVLNQVVGPPLFKWALFYVKEAHVRAQVPEFDGVRDAIIFGLNGPSMALAHSLISHGWNVKIATQSVEKPDAQAVEGLQIYYVVDWNLSAMQRLGAAGAEAVVCMTSDEDNLILCELAYEHFGTREIIVRLNDPAYFDQFHELGALIVNPSTAIVSLLDHMVRSPHATSLILGQEDHQDTIEVEVRNMDILGMKLWDIRLPYEVIVQSIFRNGQLVIPHGNVQIKNGDLLTLVGPEEALEQAALRLE